MFAHRVPGFLGLLAADRLEDSFVLFLHALAASGRLGPPDGEPVHTMHA